MAFDKSPLSENLTAVVKKQVKKIEETKRAAEEVPS